MLARELTTGMDSSACTLAVLLGGFIDSLPAATKVRIRPPNLVGGGKRFLKPVANLLDVTIDCQQRFVS